MAKPKDHVNFDTLLEGYEEHIDALVGVVGSPERARAVMAGIRMEQIYGQCTASTEWLGAAGGLSNKAFQRTLHQLHARQLVFYARRYYQISTGEWRLGTYRIMWSALWKHIDGIVQEARRRIEEAQQKIYRALNRMTMRLLGLRIGSEEREAALREMLPSVWAAQRAVPPPEEVLREVAYDRTWSFQLPAWEWHLTGTGPAFHEIFREKIQRLLRWGGVKKASGFRRREATAA